ncbi:Protein-glutamate methylesterase/protein-glutamine glutaminase [Xanthomonas sp. GW]|uniref:CheR family methyltransferase n=1 Tax=Xanthomonas sp. GW TaxID=2724121 RepID=UPI00185FF008|nr:CheR family methyltransferase [Xanthomonas sp. GW]QNH21549.1 Protein-glutamate methylesterase/protein-glutamine glutaminase [Xanthomonas sp. GW]
MPDNPAGTAEDPIQISHLDFPVVGIGASAGGLVAVSALLANLPADNGMAFVVILHLSPKHESSADQLLQRSTRMPVVQVSHPQQIERNHVYVISPSVDLLMNDGSLIVQSAARPRGRHTAIDTFFRTLSQAHRDRAVGIVLSGTGSDGAVGIAALKEYGGVTLVQSPDDSEYEDMPRNAIASGFVDFVLPVVEMPQKLMQLWQNARQIVLPAEGEIDEPTMAKKVQASRSDEEALRDILGMLSARTGHDFHHYKRATVLRRIERRLQVNLLKDIASYRDFLAANEAETAALLSDMLISVTNFFRDREAFEALERDIVPSLLERGRDSGSVRVWTPGCATGEEPYSIAMLLCDEAARSESVPAIQVFATDIDERALARARAGLYPDSIVTDVPPARLREYFNHEHHQYRVKKHVRDRVLFALHNVLRDPPFSRVDLICCRNLLIYLDREIQARLLQVFHFALTPGGYLFLGSSESADAASALFEPVDKKNRIFRARAQSRNLVTPSLPLRAGAHVGALPAPAARPRGFSFAEVHQRVLEHYAPPSVVIDQDYNIVHMSSEVGRFMQFAGGEPSYNLLAVVDPALRLELRSALFQAVHTKRSVEARQVRLERNGVRSYLNMVVRPFRDPDADANFMLVFFDEVDDTLSPKQGNDAPPAKDAVLLRLEEELQATRDRLQTTIEQSETSTEELKASNEELQAINEELRSATEELETSKEELQSLNEELTTVNYELKSKVDEAAEINDDLRNFIGSTEIATIFVDAELRIKRYTPHAEGIFSIIPADVGRRLLDITHRLDYPELAADAQIAFSSLQVREREVRAIDGRTYIARVLPYRTQENRIDGAVLTFVDVTSLRHAERQARESGPAAGTLPGEGGALGVVALDADGAISHWSAGASELLGHAPGDMLGTPFAQLYVQHTGRIAGNAPATPGAGHEPHIERRALRCRNGDSVELFEMTLPLGVAAAASLLTLLWRPAPEHPAVVGASASASALDADAGGEQDLKGDFLAVMSHELKHPLNLISVNVELLSRMSEVRDSKKGSAIVDVVKRAIHGQAKIIDDLLDLSRIRTGKLRLHITDLALLPLTRNIVDVAAADSAASELQLSLLCEEEDLLVRGDAQRVEQIVWNLVSNAIKFTPPGGRVSVRISRVGGYAGWRWKTPGWASARISCRACSTCSARPRRARPASRPGWASAWRWCGSWWTSRAAAWKPCRRASAMAAPSWCGCRWPSRSPPRRRRTQRSASRRAPACRCWWSTTAATPSTRWRRCWNWRARRSAWPPPARPRWSLPPRRASISCCRTSACPT